ncbi:MAG: MFS transporter [Phototrophicales bacterium]|nr:MAG: MFS transporter [Phototrophicales bacterium]RMG73410.1 MAG: ABC transporter ATP-binding protein [Chloroflexota bacterium]
MIEVKNLTKQYGTFTAIDHISFEAKPGEILGILGPNGAGKTTTMRILTGYMPPTSGQATIAGYDVVQDSFKARQHVGYMPERVPLYPDMTVQEYVAFWARLRGVSNVKKQVDAALERVQLKERRHSLVRNLSKGLKQRLGLAQALVHNPPVIILDEPTIGIDPKQVIEVRQSVRDLAHDHTVLFSTHILSEAEQVCDRVLIINQGRIVAQGKPEELRQQLHPMDDIYIHVSGAGKEKTERILKSIIGVDHIEARGAGYILYAKPGVDLRPHTLKTITQEGLNLLEMRPVAVTLEDIFLQIVEKEGEK